MSDAILKMRFVMVDDGPNYRTGQIIEAVSADYYLVQFDHMQDGTKRLPAELISIDEMASMNGDFRAWSFFASAEDRQQWLDEIDSPSAPRVVSLVQK